MTSIEHLAQQHAEHQARAAELQAQLEQERATIEAARQARLAEHDRATVAAYDATEQAMQEEEKQARDAFRAAVLADPMVTAWITYRAVRHRRNQLRTAVNSAMHLLGSTDRPPIELRYYDPKLLEDVLKFAEEEARNIAADEADERAAARDAAGEGDG